MLLLLIFAAGTLLLPIGLALAAGWAARRLTGIWTIIPALQNFLLEHGVGLLGAPNWTLGGVEDATMIGLIQTVALLGGFAGSLLVAHRIAAWLYRHGSMAGCCPGRCCSC